MPNLTQDTLNSLLSNIPDPKQRKIISDIANGRIVKKVICTKGSEETHKKGAVIAYIYDSGRIEALQDEEGRMMLRSSRDRFDGNKGFECWCGNDSRICKEEKGNIDTSGNPPTKQGLENIIENLRKKKWYPNNSGSQEIDGFIIEEVA